MSSQLNWMSGVRPPSGGDFAETESRGHSILDLVAIMVGFKACSDLAVYLLLGLSTASYLQ